MAVVGQPITCPREPFVVPSSNHASVLVTLPIRGTVIVATVSPRTSIHPCTSAPEHVAVMPVKAPAAKLPPVLPPILMNPDAGRAAAGFERGARADCLVTQA